MKHNSFSVRTPHPPWDRKTVPFVLGIVKVITSQIFEGYFQLDKEASTSDSLLPEGYVSAL